MWVTLLCRIEKVNNALSRRTLLTWTSISWREERVKIGISRKTFYKWWPYYAKEGLPGLKDRSERPKSDPKSVGEEIAQIIVKLRQESHYQMNYPGQRVHLDGKYMPTIVLSDHPEPYKENQYCGR